jgi:hypothetical protein
VHEEPTQLADAHTHVLFEHEPLGAAQDGEQPPTTDCSQLMPKKVVLPTVLQEHTHRIARRQIAKTLPRSLVAAAWAVLLAARWTVPAVDAAARWKA